MNEIVDKGASKSQQSLQRKKRTEISTLLHVTILRAI